MCVSLVPGPVLLGADNGPRTRDLHHGKVALFRLSYIRVEPSAGFAPAPSSLPRKRPDSGTARAWAGAFGPARTGCLPFTRRLLYLVSYEGTEPPSGADPDRPPYEGGAAAVRGGVASGAGLEPAMAGVRALQGRPAPHPELVRAERFELSCSRV